MALLERVATLLRANVGDLLTKAEDPEKLARQLVVDMENQLIQVKTQVAIAIADQHLLQTKRLEQEEAQAQWMKKAESALSKGEEAVARVAAERALSHRRMAEGLSQQCADQTAEADTLKSAYTRLQAKLAETQSRVDLLATQLRRHRAVQLATEAQAKLQEGSRGGKLWPLRSKVAEAGSRGRAARAMAEMLAPEALEERFSNAERDDQVEALLLELRERLG